MERALSNCSITIWRASGIIVDRPEMHTGINDVAIGEAVRRVSPRTAETLNIRLSRHLYVLVGIAWVVQYLPGGRESWCEGIDAK